MDLWAKNLIQRFVTSKNPKIHLKNKKTANFKVEV